MLHPTAHTKMRALQNCLVAGITMLAATHALRAQDTTLVPCNGAPVGATYCYANNDEHVWYWHSECGYPVVLQFTSGTIESSLYDHLRIYDGADELSPLVYSNGSSAGTEDLTGSQFVGSSGDLYMHMTSNATNCCATDGFRGVGWEWVWSVSSGSVGIQEEQAGNFTMSPNPATSALHIRLQSPTNGPTEIMILDVTGRVVFHNSFSASGAVSNTFDVHGLQSGHYSVVLTTPNGVKTRKLQVTR